MIHKVEWAREYKRLEGGAGWQMEKITICVCVCVCVFIHTYLHDVCLQYVNGLYICGLLTVAIIFT